MSKHKVLLVQPSPRQMQLISPLVSHFYNIFKNHDIDMEFFDTTFYDVTDTYINPDEKMAEIGSVKNINSTELPSFQKIKTHNQLLIEWRNKVKTYNPDVIFASCVESTVNMTREILGSVRDLGVPHVLGGVFPTYAPEKALNYPEVDIICVGEGETIIVELVRRLAGKKNLQDNGSPKTLQDISNIWFHDVFGNMVKKPLGSPIDMEDLPKFDITPFEDSRLYRAMGGKVYRMLPVETARGCPLKCTFCNSPVQNEAYKEHTGESYYRKRSIPKVMEDIRYFVEDCGAEYLFFWADHFLAYTQVEIDEFCEAYSDFKVPFYAQTYPSSVNEKKIESLVKVGLDRIGMGVEHGNEVFRRDVIKRNYSNKKAMEKVEVLRKFGIQYSCNNIVGYPHETPELHWDTVMLNRALKADSTSAAIFTPFEGTPLRRMALEAGFLKDPNVLAPSNFDRSVLDMPQFPPDLIAGKSRTFNLYVHLPESRWDHIKTAEKFTDEGNYVFNQLKQELIDMENNDLH